jgi:hypothetical protein
VSYRGDLVLEIQRLKKRRDGTRSDRDTFPGWLLLTNATLNEEKALDAIVGGPHDRGLDAIHVDDDKKNRTVWIVQGKFPDAITNANEDREDVLEFARIAEYLTGSEGKAPEFWADLALNQYNAPARFRVARDAVRRRFAVRMIYATLGRFDPLDMSEAEDIVKSSLRKATIEFYDRDEIGRRLDDYLYDISPSVGPITLPVLEESVTPVKDAGVAAFSFSIQGSVLAKLYDDVGDQLFARNIRWYMGENLVNDDITATVRTSPERFWLYNNGVTFICDGAGFDFTAHNRDAKIEGGQIVNGQQTTRTLHALWQRGPYRVQVERVRVPVRVIEIGSDNAQRRDQLISGIVRATNWQTAVSMADLRSNEREQIVLQRDLYARGYVYRRKRAAAGEAPPVERPRNYVATLSKEELARAVAGVDGPGRALIEGITPLFDNRYKTIFGHTVGYYLACFWMWRKVRDGVRGDAIRKQSKYIVHYELWHDANRFLSRRLDEFARACAGKDVIVLDPLGRAIEALFVVADKTYLDNSSSNGKEVPASTYFKRDTSHDDFIGVWNGTPNGLQQRRYQKAIFDLEIALP